MPLNSLWRAFVLAAVSIVVSACALGTTDHATSAGEQQASTRVKYKTVDVRGIKIFYREAGDPKKPTLLLLHGFPSSSHMYRELIPLLANDFHLVAPDYPGAGFSDSPTGAQFPPTFENLADLMAEFASRVGLRTYVLYMQDFGGPVGFRMAVKHPEAIKGLVIQNANAYLAGIAPAQLEGMRAPQRQQIEPLVSRAFTLFMYRTGARDFAAMDPTSWNIDAWVLDNPEAKRIQTALMLDYHSNLSRYADWQAYLRARQPKTLILWGRNDPIFLPAGAEAYRGDLPKATLRFYDTGHFALEEEAPSIAHEIRSAFRSE